MRRRSRWSAVLTLLGLPAIIVLWLAVGLSGGVAAPQRILADVSVGPLRLQGVTRAEAAALLAELTPEQVGWSLRFVCGERCWQPSAVELGVSVDVEGTLSDVWRAGQTNALARFVDRLARRQRRVTMPARLRLDEGTLRDCLGRLAGEVNVPPRNACFDFRTGQVVSEAAGRRVDINRAVAEVRAAVQSGRGETVELVLLVVEPATKAADLAVIGSDELARFTTYYRADVVDRATNIALAVARLNGTIIEPGQVFSFNQTVGPRTRELGYREALEIINGEYVPGVGGGVCQVSSTLYNAGLLAGLTVVERYPHSRKPIYVEPGRDATVVYDSLDLRLRNDRRTPVLIVASADNGVLSVALRGRAEPGERYVIETSVVETIAAGIKQEPDPTLAPGTEVVKEKPVDGVRVRVFRVARVGGKTTRQQISEDTYQPVTGVVRVAPLAASGPDSGAADAGAPGRGGSDAGGDGSSGAGERISPP